jgi:hypothetical protein
MKMYGRVTGKISKIILLSPAATLFTPVGWNKGRGAGGINKQEKGNKGRRRGRANEKSAVNRHGKSSQEGSMAKRPQKHHTPSRN